MAERLADGLWLLELGWMPPLASNAYLLEDEGVTVVDAGLPRNHPEIDEEIRAAGYEVGDVERVLVTHYDVDHVGGLARLRPDFDGPVYVGREDARLARGDDDPPLAHHKGAFHRVARRFFTLDGADVREVRDGDAFDGFTAYHTPGHNPGHTVYVHESGVAFLGDLVWEEQGALTPPFWLDSYDMRQVHRSIGDLADRVPPFEVAAVGHGTPIRTGGHDALVDLAARLGPG